MQCMCFHLNCRVVFIRGSPTIDCELYVKKYESSHEEYL